MPSINFQNAIRDTIMVAVHQMSFKDGAFKLRIPKDPAQISILESFDILIKSDLTSAEEKEALITAKNACFRFNLKYPEGGKGEPELEDLLACTREMKGLDDIFENDAKARGLYVPPDMVQIFNKDGTVKETHVVNVDGSTTMYQGGKPMVPPGAPDGFAMQNQAFGEKVTKGLHDSERKTALGRYDLNNLKAEPTSKSGSSKATGTPTQNSGEKPSGKGKVKGADFGADFSNNLKGAFI